MVRIDLGDLNHISPVRNLRRLVFEHFISEVIEGLQFIPREDEDLVRPFLILNVINSVLPLCY